jgi:hypothetical protein
LRHLLFFPLIGCCNEYAGLACTQFGSDGLLGSGYLDVCILLFILFAGVVDCDVCILLFILFAGVVDCDVCILLSILFAGVVDCLIGLSVSGIK